MNSRVILSDRRSSIDTQYELLRIAKCEYRDQESPIGIDQKLYPEYNDLPDPYKPFTHYMRKYNYTIPSDWQTRQCSHGYLPLLPDMPNFILGPGPRTTPRLKNADLFIQLDECNRYCKHDSWPDHLVIAVIDPSTCRGCNDQFSHFHLQKSTDRHDYFRLSRAERALCFIDFSTNTPLPFFPPEMPMTYSNRLGSSSSTSTITIPRTINTRMTAAYTPHIPTSTGSQPTSFSPTSDTPVYIKTESLNMMFRAPPESTPAPESVAANNHITNPAVLPQAAARLFPKIAGTFDVNVERGPPEPPLPPRSPQGLAPFSELRYLRPVMVVCIKSDLDDDVPDLITVNGYLSPDTVPHTYEPIPYRPADEFASQAAQAQRHFHQRPTADDGYTFNTVSRGTYLSLAYGANPAPAEHPIEYTATSILYICADYDLRMARLSNITYPGTYLVVSQEPGPPVAVPDPLRTRTSTLLATHSSRIDVLRAIRALPDTALGVANRRTYVSYADYLIANPDILVLHNEIAVELAAYSDALLAPSSLGNPLAMLPQDTDMAGAVHHLVHNPPLALISHFLHPSFIGPLSQIDTEMRRLITDPTDNNNENVPPPLRPLVPHPFNNPSAMLPQDADTIVGLPNVATSFGDFLALVNSHFHQGIPPPTVALDPPVADAANIDEAPAPVDDADPDADMYTDTMPVNPSQLTLMVLQTCLLLTLLPQPLLYLLPLYILPNMNMIPCLPSRLLQRSVT